MTGCACLCHEEQVLDASESHGCEDCHGLHEKAVAVPALGLQPKREVRTVHDYFGLSYASFLTLPRVVLEAMPEGWQERFVAMLDEIRDEFPSIDEPQLQVHARRRSRMIPVPAWMRNYRRPNRDVLDSFRRPFQLQWETGESPRTDSQEPERG